MHTFCSLPLHDMNTAASQISSIWKSIQMWAAIIKVISHLFTQQLSHEGLAGTVGSQLQCLLIRQWNHFALWSQETHNEFHSKCQDTLYTFLTADTGARFILFSRSAISEKPNSNVSGMTETTYSYSRGQEWQDNTEICGDLVWVYNKRENLMKVNQSLFFYNLS